MQGHLICIYVTKSILLANETVMGGLKRTQDTVNFEVEFTLLIFSGNEHYNLQFTRRIKTIPNWHVP